MVNYARLESERMGHTAQLLRQATSARNDEPGRGRRFILNVFSRDEVAVDWLDAEERKRQHSRGHRQPGQVTLA